MVKRGMVGGAHRGPVAHSRQRRTLRLVQILLVLIGAGMLMFAGYSMGRSDGYEDGKRSDELGAPEEPGLAEVLVPGLLGLGALGGALAMQGQGGIRMPTPARLDELAGRAERAAIDRAEAQAATNPGPVETKDEAGSSADQEKASSPPTTS